MKEIKGLIAFFAVFLLSALNIAAQSIESLGLSKENSAYIETLPDELQEALVEELDQKLSLQQQNANSTAQLTPNVSSLLDKALYGIDQRDQNKFGYDFFNKIPLTYSPLFDVPIANDYKISIGDVLVVSFVGPLLEGSNEVDVALDGNIFIENIGKFYVYGKSTDSIEEDILKKLEDIYPGTEIIISPKELKPIQVYILGEVETPGIFNFNALTTVSNALINAGGVKDSGSLRNITLQRINGEKLKIDLYDLLIYGDRSNDQRLVNGDTILINSVGRFVEVYGEVNRPKFYELDAEDSYQDLINFAGGYTSYSDFNQTSIKYRTGNSLSDLKASDLTNIEIGSVFEIFVPKIDFIDKEGVKVKGPVLSDAKLIPGYTLEEAVNSLEFNRDLYPYYGILKNNIDKQGSKYRSFSTISPPKDVVLEEGSELIFFSILDIQTLNIFESYKMEKQEIEEKIVSSQQLEFTDVNDSLIKDSTKDENLINFTTSRRSFSNYEINKFVDKYDSFNLKLIEDLENDSDLFEFIVSDKVDVSGAIKSQLFLPANGETDIFKAISMMGGLKNSANLSEVYFSDPTNNIYQKIVAGETIEIKSGGGKAISIPVQANLSVTVKIDGEVNIPGTYTLKEGSTLQDLYDLAGGFKSSASQEAIILKRADILANEEFAVQEAQRNLIVSVANNIVNPSTEGTGASALTKEIIDLLVLSAAAEPTGRLVGDLSYSSINAQKLELKNEDDIFIPGKISTISVLGEVRKQVTTLYSPSSTLRDYLNISGGFTDFSDKSGIYVIRSNGTNVKGSLSLFGGNSVVLRPGDTIVVPKKLLQVRGLALVSTASKVISDVAFTAASLNSLNN
ncbi:MAG: SLBB domain-containing protein [SAR86 cluster bacterium]|nr:SLBB domain-containing protein [SAR86 cluster bacterium]